MVTSRMHAERGFLLIPVLFIVLILGGLSAAFLTEGLGDRTAIRHRETSMKAMELAEAGLHRAQMEIFAQADPDGDGIGTVSGEMGGGEYQVVCEQDATNPDRYTATARGEHGLSVRRLEVGLRYRANAYFVEGLFSKEDMTLDGTIATDSYDATKGSWNSQAKHHDSDGQYAGKRGHVGSNAGILASGSSVAVRGNAIPGPGFKTETTGNPTILGDRLPRQVEIDLPPPDEAEFKAALLNNANNGIAGPAYDHHKMDLDAMKDVVLKGGTYFFSSIKLTGQAKLIVEGPSKIYVTGPVDLTGGGVVNKAGLPSDLQIFAHPYRLLPTPPPKNADMKVNGGAQVAAAIYAPDVDITIGGDGDIFGSVVGNKIVVHGNAYFHWDESLRMIVANSTPTLERLYWRELSPAAR